MSDFDFVCIRMTESLEDEWTQEKKDILLEDWTAAGIGNDRQCTRLHTSPGTRISDNALPNVSCCHGLTGQHDRTLIVVAQSHSVNLEEEREGHHPSSVLVLIQAQSAQRSSEESCC